MTDYGNNNQKQASYAYANVPPRGNETALMIEGLYNGLTYDLQKMKKELMNELKYNALQASSLYQSVQKETSSATEANGQTAQSMIRELKYGYQQNQMIYESLSAVLTDDVLKKLETVEVKVELLEQIDKMLAEIKEKLDDLEGEKLAETVKDKVVEALAGQEGVDYEKITESVSEKTESSLAAHSKQVLDAVAAIPVAENVDYARIVDEVSEAVLEKLQSAEVKEEEPAKVQAEIDYDRIIYGAAEKVVESLPYPEKVDYNRMDENFVKAAESVKLPEIDEEALASGIAAAVEKAVAEADIAAAVERAIAQANAETAADENAAADASERIDYERLSDMVVAKMPVYKEPEAVDYDLLAESIIAKMPVHEEPEAIDYDKLADAVIAKLPAPAEPEPIDYDKLADTVIAKLPALVDYEKITEAVAEKIPQPEMLDYAAMAENVVERMPVQKEAEAVDYDRIYQAAQAAECISDPVDYDRIAELIDARMSSAPEIALPEAEEIDYELLSDKVAEKVVLPEIEVAQPEEIDYELLAEMVAQKIVVPEAPTYDMVVDEDGAKSIAECVAEKITVPTFDVLVDDEGAEKIADAVVEKMRGCCPASQATEETSAEEEIPEEETVSEPEKEEAAAETEPEAQEEEAAVEVEAVEEAPAEETISEQEEPVEEPAEEEAAPAEETAGEAAEEQASVEEEAALAEAEEPAAAEEKTEPAPEELLAEAEESEIVSEAESTIETEIALTQAEAAAYEEVNDNLVDADTGLVIRLKRSFTAKMKQSDPVVKHYYSEVKNELTSYKRLNSNLSWHADRFNFGRDTVAKITICGKTLCFYLALDPNDPEYKTTVYHQRDVGGQKAYENTPFMVKIKSDAALKKALRLVGFLAEKLGTEKDDKFEAVDYAEQFCHESTKQLLEDGLIKVTKEKKVVLDFN